jgi:hypothetical protein
MLPASAADVLKKVGIEIAVAASDDEAVEEVLASIAESSEEDEVPVGPGVAITHEHLPDLWQQELEAWSMLLDGSALDNHVGAGSG